MDGAGEAKKTESGYGERADSSILTAASRAKQGETTHSRSGSAVVATCPARALVVFDHARIAWWFTPSSSSSC